MFLVSKRKESAEGWISSADVFLSVLAITKSLQEAQNILKMRLINDKWSAQSKSGILQLDYGSLPTALPNVSDNTRKQIGPLLIDIYSLPSLYVQIFPQFWDSQRSLFVEELWDWRSGVFASVGFFPTGLVQIEGDNRWLVEVPKRWVAFGVEFAAETVAAFLSEISARIDAGKSEKQTKPRNKKWPYAPVLAELESDIETGNMSRFGDLEDFGAQAKIERFIRNRLREATGDEPPKSTVRAKAQVVMKQWKQREELGR